MLTKKAVAEERCRNATTYAATWGGKDARRMLKVSNDGPEAENPGVRGSFAGELHENVLAEFVKPAVWGL